MAGPGGACPPSLPPPTQASTPPEPRTLADVVSTFRSHFYLPDERPLVALLGAVAANLFPGEPVWFFLLGPPSSGKTALLLTLLGLSHVRLVAVLSPAALLSATPRKDKAAGAKGGLLRDVGAFGILLAKDLTSLLSQHPDAQKETLAALREIYDGRWVRHAGSDGGQVLEWVGKVGFVGGVTDAIERAHAVGAEMGERSIYYRMPVLDDERIGAKMGQALKVAGADADARRATLAGSVSGLFAGLGTAPALPPVTDEDRPRLFAMAQLAARCRSAVERDHVKRDVVLVHEPEDPTRLMLTLAKLQAGMALLGADPAEAWAIAAKVAADSVPKMRRRVIDALAGRSEPVATDDLGTSFGLQTSSARRALEDLEAHGVVDRTVARPAHLWALSAWARDLYTKAGSSSFRGDTRRGGEEG